MTTLKISDGLVKDDLLVVGLVSTNSKGGIAIESGDLALDSKSLLASLLEMGATGKADEVTKMPGGPARLMVFTGLGPKSSTYSHEVLRRAAGSAARALAGNSGATFALPARDLAGVSAVAEGAALGAYAFNDFRGSSKDSHKSALKSATIFSKLAGKSEAKEITNRASIIAKYTYLVRDLINTPPSHLTPDSFTKKLAASFKAAGGAKAGLKIKVGRRASKGGTVQFKDKFDAETNPRESHSVTFGARPYQLMVAQQTGAAGAIYDHACIKTKNTNFVNNLNVQVGNQPRAIDPAVEKHRYTVQYAVKKIVDDVADVLNKKLKVRYGN